MRTVSFSPPISSKFRILKLSSESCFGFCFLEIRIRFHWSWFLTGNWLFCCKFMISNAVSCILLFREIWIFWSYSVGDLGFSWWSWQFVSDHDLWFEFMKCRRQFEEFSILCPSVLLYISWILSIDNNFISIEDYFRVYFWTNNGRLVWSILQKGFAGR